VIVEDVDDRVWAALRPIDAITRAPISAINEPMRIEGAGQRWLANRSGLMVLRRQTEPAARTEEFARHEASFAAPTLVDPPVELAVTITDPRGRYLARRATLRLPRSPLPAAPGVLPELFSPLEVPMYAAPHAPLPSSWALLRASVTRAGLAAAGAVLTVHEPGNAARVLGRGQADARGEALLAVIGVPAFIPSGGAAAFVRTRAVEVTVVFDAAAAAAGTPPDPEALFASADAALIRLTAATSIGSAATAFITLTLP
jgi:hypothetical protein